MAVCFTDIGRCTTRDVAIGPGSAGLSCTILARPMHPLLASISTEFRMTTTFASRRRAWLCPLAFAFALAGCGGDSDEPRAGDVVSASTYSGATAVNANARLIVYRMRGVSGTLVDASTLVFVPHGNAPAGGWPIVGWIHGTTTVGQATCAPSSTPVDLDGGLSADAAPLGVPPSGYAGFIAALVNAGYAVVAPDLEGLGTAAKVPYPYYSIASQARSLIEAVEAARNDNRALSNRWASAGHSDGAHGVLGLEAYVGEAPELSYQGAVAFAPFASVSDQVKLLDNFAAGDPANLASYRAFQNLLVGMMTAGLTAQQPSFPIANIMGADLAAEMPAIKNKCIFPAFVDVSVAVATKTPALFDGFKPAWDTDPSMKAFLLANDPGAIAGFKVLKPTLVLQGTADANVFESQVAGLVTDMTSAGSTSLTYKTYVGANHQTVIPAATADALAFLATLLH
jgi:alpha-beta hydrolase superfamily lysophospholipase